MHVRQIDSPHVSLALVEVEHVCERVREEMEVEDDRGDVPPLGSERPETGHERCTDEQVGENAILARYRLSREDFRLVAEAPDRRPDHPDQRLPAPGVDPRDDEVIQVDQDPETASVGDDGQCLEQRTAVRDAEDPAGDDRDEEVVFRVDRRSPVPGSSVPSL